ncbi:MAG TPA: acetoin utilization protein AcuC, partial [Thiotrichales bacterium]|nr:acetoin utilization protein AcuC [Thiotrichales bacterium]
MSDSSVAIIAGPSLADYHFGEAHAFGPQRHQAFLDGIEQLGIQGQFDWLSPVRCDEQCLQRFHNRDFIDKVRQASKLGIGYLDQGDTPARTGIFEAASTVVGSVIDMVDRIMQGQYRRGFVP